MILQKNKAREYKGKTIYKFIIVVPPNDIEQLGWTKGQELKGERVSDKGYILFLA